MNENKNEKKKMDDYNYNDFIFLICKLMQTSSLIESVYKLNEIQNLFNVS